MTDVMTKREQESFRDQRARVALMASGADTWDLSDNDTAALMAMIHSYNALVEAAKHAAMEWRLHGQLTDSCRKLEAAVQHAESR